MSKLKDNKNYSRIAEAILKAFYSEYEKEGIHGAIYGLAVQEFLAVNNLNSLSESPL